MMCLETKKQLGLPINTGSEEKGVEQTRLRSFSGSMALMTLAFQLLASRTGTQYIFDVFSHPSLRRLVMASLGKEYMFLPLAFASLGVFMSQGDINSNSQGRDSGSAWD